MKIQLRPGHTREEVLALMDKHMPERGRCEDTGAACLYVRDEDGARCAVGALLPLEVCTDLEALDIGGIADMEMRAEDEYVVYVADDVSSTEHAQRELSLRVLALLPVSVKSANELQHLHDTGSWPARYNRFPDCLRGLEEAGSLTWEEPS